MRGPEDPAPEDLLLPGQLAAAAGGATPGDYAALPASPYVAGGPAMSSPGALPFAASPARRPELGGAGGWSAPGGPVSPGPGRAPSLPLPPPLGAQEPALECGRWSGGPDPGWRPAGAGLPALLEGY
jgi:hypothetical protein